MIQRLKGTRDILGKESSTWKYVENVATSLFENYGYNEIRVPVIESLDLFERGVGEGTDVVQKEMYCFEDKGGRKIALRPEGTAGVVRAYIENGLSSEPSPIKFWYHMPMYRYENVQKGRQREFNQIGVELFGSNSYMADVETIDMANAFMEKLNIKDFEININSIGCTECRKKYIEALKAYIKPNLDSYCETCKTRFEKNTMRILDCKEAKCKNPNSNAPVILDYLCEECKTHFENVKNGLTTLGINYKIDSSIVRGLDYYSKTVFEFVSKIDGLTVLGGGRYDGLIEELGGIKTPAIGFATGEERLISLFEANNDTAKLEKNIEIFVAYIGEEANKYSANLVKNLRQAGIYAEKDIMERSLKAQFKYADKKKAKYVLTLGEDEIKTGKATLKEMETGNAFNVELENIEKVIKEKIG